MNRILTVIVISSITAGLVASSLSVAAARTDAPPRRPVPAVAAGDRRAEMGRVLTVLDRKVADPMVRRKAAEKLVVLSSGQIHLIASLADRLAVDGEGPAAGIALLLITALLIVS